MQAVILAGGLGTRLGGLTRQVPKPMVPVAGRPYLEHQLVYLADQNIREVLLLTGYLGEQVESYFGNGGRWGLSIRYSRELQPLGTGGALKLACNLLAAEFLLLYGDSFLPIEYTQVLRRMNDTSAQGCVVVYDNRQGDSSVRNNIGLRADGWIACYRKVHHPDPELTHVEAGALALRRGVVSLIREGVVSLEMEIFPQLISRGELVAFETRQRFYDIGTPERLSVFEEYLQQ